MSLYGELLRRWSNTDGPRLHTPEGLVDAAELRTRVARARGWLRHRGLSCGDRVALQMPRSLAFLELHLAALAEGIATLPLNPRYTPHERDWILSDASPACVVVLSPTGDQLDAAHIRAELDASAERHEAPIDDPEAIGLLCYTSGTTGRPKGARIRQRNLQACIRALHDAWGFGPSDVLLHALPMFHIHGLVVAQHVALYAGATTRWLPRFDPDAVLDQLEGGDISVFMGVPTFYNRMLATERRGSLPVRLLTSGSAPLPARVWHEVRERFGHEVLERYGMTEVGIVLSNPLDGPRLPGSVGLPLPGVSVRVVGPSDAALPPNEVGQVLIQGPSVFEGYLNRPDATREALRGGWMHTGDLGLIDANGYVHLRGRGGDLILVGGFNVYPPEVESVLLDMPGVAQAVVIGIPDGDLGERVVAAVITEPGLDLERLRAFAAERLTAYKVPAEIRRVAAFPRNAMGKVQRAVMRSEWDKTKGPQRAPFADEVREATLALQRAGRASVELPKLQEYAPTVRRGDLTRVDDQIVCEVLDHWLPDKPEATVGDAMEILGPLSAGVDAARLHAEAIAHKQHEALHDPIYEPLMREVTRLSNDFNAVQDRAAAYDTLRESLQSVADAVEERRAYLTRVRDADVDAVEASIAASLWKLIGFLDLTHLLDEPGEDVPSWMESIERRAQTLIEEDRQTLAELTQRTQALQARIEEMMG